MTFRSFLACICIFTALFSVVIAAQAGLLFPTSYTGAEIKAKIIDADTGKPLQGVLVLVSWDNVTPGYTDCSLESGCGYSCVELVNLNTVFSDALGQIDVPGWSEKSGHCRYMPDNQPELLLYKPGYGTRRLTNSDNGYSHASDSSVSHSRWNGKTIKLYQLGPHRFGGYTPRTRDNIYPVNTMVDSDGDNHYLNFEYFAAQLGNILENPQSEPSVCFWQEARPAMLMMLKEKRRLDYYTKYKPRLLDDHIAHPDQAYGTKWSCGNQQAYLEQLDAEANQVKREIAPWPRVMDYSEHNPQAVGGFGVPKLNMPSTEDLAPGGIANTSVIYHIGIDPQNPNYMRGIMLMPMDRKIDTGFDGTVKWAYGDSHNQNTYDYVCSSDVWVYKVRPQHGEVKDDIGCRWFVSLDMASSLVAREFGSANTERPLDYNFLNHRWHLNENALMRPPGIKVPEYLEIDSPVQLTISTSLVPAGHQRWVLPTRGLPFSMQIVLGNRHASEAADKAPNPESDICIRALPKDLIVALSKAFSRVRVAMATDVTPENRPTDHCPWVLKGRFSDEGTGYIVVMFDEHERGQMIVAALPKGDGWDMQALRGNLCSQLKYCRLSLAKPGEYKRISPMPVPNQWSYGPPMPETLTTSYDGVFINGEGLRGEKARTVSAYQNGEWKFVLVDPDAGSQ